jgi:hypothetical protein
MAFKYREMVIHHLLSHGIRPDATTPPELVRDFINGLYLYEIRKLKSHLQNGLIAQKDYAGAVLSLRNRYPVLGIPLQFWTDED